MEQKKLGFGLMRLPVLDKEDSSKIDTVQMNKMVDTFLERGFTYFDTAYMYHKYNSENAIREALVKRHPRDSFTLATKLPTMFLEKEEDMERIFNEQCEKCGVDYFDFYLLHSLNAKNYATAEKLGAFEFVSEKKKEGKVRQMGFSFHDTAELLDEILTKHPEVDFIQLQINYLDWDNESIESGKCYKVAEKHNKKVVVMEPVKGGTLAQVPEEVETMFKEYHGDMSVASWAIRYAASLKNVFMVLSGMSDMEQLLDNTSYMQNFKPLNDEEKELVDKAVKAINRNITVPCTACEYCVEGCPKHIPIPKYFTLFNAEKVKGGSAQQNQYNDYIHTHGKASDCIHCRKCEKICPQHIDIVDKMKKVSEIFD